MNRRAFAAIPAGLFATFAAIVPTAARTAMTAGRNPLPAGSRNRADGIAASSGAELIDAEIPARDGAMLRAWLFRLRAASGRAVIILHGIGDTRNGVLGHAQFLLTHGYHVLVADVRAQGESGGELMTYGVLEADDTKQWAGWIEERTGARDVFGLGESLGAGIMIQAAAGETPLRAAVAESPFSSFRDAAYLRIGQAMGAGEGLGRVVGAPLVPAMIAWARMRYGIDLDRASPKDAVRGVRIPLPVIHGLADENLPIEHARRIAEAAVNRVEYWEVPEGRHTGAYSIAPAEFTRRVLGLFDRAAAASGGRAMRH